jgi:hypothetical protein
MMLANKFGSPALRSLFLQPTFAFSAKKKQIELTLRTPYRTPPPTQAPSSRTSPASAR